MSEKWISLGPCNRVLVYYTDQNGDPVFTKPFLQLWTYLYWAGQFQFRDGGIAASGFNVPPVPKTVATGFGQAVSDTSPVRLIAFTIDVNNGPIEPVDPTFPFYLSLFQDNLIYKVDWRIVPKSSNYVPCSTNIGFYTSQVFQFQVTNDLQLTTSNKGINKFKQDKGSFLTTNIENLYVAVDQDVLVNLVVTAITPEEVFYSPPDYTQYLHLEDECGGEYNLPVYTDTVVGDGSDGTSVRVPSALFQSTFDVIQAYLEKYALSLTLYQDTLSSRKQLLAPGCYDYGFIDRQYSSSNYGYYATFNTTGRVNSSMSAVKGLSSYNAGFQIDTYTLLYPFITYSITLLPGSRYPSEARVSMQSKLPGWEYLNQVNPTDGKQSKAEENFKRGERVWKGFFILPSNTKHFNITVYYKGPNNDVAKQASINTVFTQVKLGYIQLPWNGVYPCGEP